MSIGDPIDRVDGRVKVTGKATYAADTAVSNVAYAAIATSSITRGTVASIDTKAARGAAGVIAVITHDNALKLATKKGTPQDKVLNILDEDAVHYSDQPIAVVVADTHEHAQHAAGLLAVSYAASTERVAADVAGAIADAYKPAKAGPSGESDSKKGDVDPAMRAAAATIDQTYTTPVETHNPLEPHATVAVWQGDDHLTVYDATQGVFGVRARLATLFDLKVENVRVIDPFVGGGFGCKGSMWSHVALCAMAAKVAKRPVKLAITRQQMASLVGHRPETIQRVQLGVDAQNKLVAIRHAVTSETSRFDEFVEPSAVQTRMLYACPNIETSHRLVRLDIPTPTFMRAPGESSGTFALESAMDELARAVNIDPVELRIRNHADRDPEKDIPWSSKSLLECYRRGAEMFGWSTRDKVRTRDGKRVGYGMATATYPSRQLAAAARATLRADGTALVQSGTQDLGTGAYTILTQLAADILALPVDKVRFELGDTALPEAPVSGGSFTTSSAGSAVAMVSHALIDELAKLAAEQKDSPLKGIPRDKITVAEGALVAGSARDSFAAIVGRTGKPEVTVTKKTEPNKANHENYSSHAFGAMFVEVEVDPLLAMTRVSRAVGVFGAGKILNAKTARSQLIGGMVWGIGMALFEETRRDPRTARATTRDLADYHVPTHADIPDIQVLTIDEKDAFVNEIGAKGIGEIGITGITAAIANAVFDATGIRVRSLPITVDKLLAGGLSP